MNFNIAHAVIIASVTQVVSLSAVLLFKAYGRPAEDQPVQPVQQATESRSYKVGNSMVTEFRSSGSLCFVLEYYRSISCVTEK